MQHGQSSQNTLCRGFSLKSSSLSLISRLGSNRPIQTFHTTVVQLIQKLTMSADLISWTHHLTHSVLNLTASASLSYRATVSTILITPPLSPFYFSALSTLREPGILPFWYLILIIHHFLATCKTSFPRLCCVCWGWMIMKPLIYILQK